VKPEEMKVINIGPLETFLVDCNKQGFAKAALHLLVPAVYPSYKLTFLGALIAIMQKRHLPKVTHPTSVCLQVLYFKQPKDKCCVMTSLEVVGFFDKFFLQQKKAEIKKFREMVKDFVCCCCGFGC
jgi:hypothetical protein